MVHKKKSEENVKVEKEPEDKKSCVYIICAHSDDQILGPGGTVAKYSKEGIDVHTIILSYGEFSHPWMQGHVTVKTRVKEAQKADKIIGGKSVTFLGVKEGKFGNDIKRKRLIQKIKKLIEKQKPSKIFTHSFNDPLPDHQETLKFVLEIVKRCRKKPDIYTFPIWNPIAVRNRNRPKLIVDISKHFKTKLKALLTFKSQKLSILQLLPSVAIKNFVAGYSYGFRFAELFYKVDTDELKKKRSKKEKDRS